MKTIIITGAGSGIGRATAGRLAAEQDIALILIGRNAQKLQETLTSLLHPERHSIAAIDISQKGEMARTLNALAAKHPDIFGLFANAGIGGSNHFGPDDRWSEIVRVNLDGTYFSIMETLPYLKQSTESYKNILITSSCLARFGVPEYTAYCTTKTGLLGLTRSLAVELASQKIIVNALCPGWVDTDMARAGVQLLADKEGTTLAQEIERQESFVPLGKFSQPTEIAEFAAFMLLNKQTSITGQALDINNGSFMI